MAVTLRPYQEEALAAVVSACLEERFLLLQAATGAGKTILFSELIKRFMGEYDMRIAIVAHREVLVRQAYEKLLKVWPEAVMHVGLACSSVSSEVRVDRPVTIGSPQTLARRLGVMPPPHLVIRDEVHRLPPANEKSQDRELIDAWTGYYPELRVLGVTATPFRFGHGYIYGERCRPGKKNWFPRLHYSIGISTLQDQGFLVPYRALEAENIDAELAGVRTDKGEFNTADLAGIMSKEVHVGSAVNAYQEHGQGRRHVVAFCVTIDHAEKVRSAFEAAGYQSGIVHSQMSKEARDFALRRFDAGELRVICNVGVLTEGWDSTAVDCLIMCRPTLSPALYVQIIGRGLRTHPGKTDCLVLDLSGNCARHGDPDDPRVTVPGQNKRKVQASDEPVGKICPACKLLAPSGAVECRECGHEFPRPVVQEINEAVSLRDVHWAPFPVRVDSARAESYLSRAGNRMLKVAMTCFNGGTVPILVNHFMDIEGHASSYGQSKAFMLWRRLSGGQEPPRTVDEAVTRFGEITLPAEVLIKQDGKYFNVTRW